MQTCLEHKHDMSGKYHGCSEQVCALTMFALSQNFRVIVLEHKPSIYGNYFQKLHCIRRLGYNSINHVL